jgi:3'(2'), 5'-bisphosphate nucleotidase
MIDNKKLILDICNISIRAGNKILEYYKDDIEVTHKNDSSPLTKADLASNKIIKTALHNLDTTIPILSEESLVAWSTRKSWNKYWLVDPLDGTKEFIKNNGEFTVNIALVEKNNPILGVIFAPAKSAIYFAQKGYGTFTIDTSVELNSLDKATQISVLKQSDPVRIIGSRSHSNNSFTTWVNEKFPNAQIIQAGSSLKFCLIANGNADIYPRFGPTSEWDIAAGHIILNEAGGKILTLSNKEIKYNQKESLLNPEFIASNNTI